MMNAKLAVVLSLLSTIPCLQAAAPGPVKNRAPLAPNAFYPLPLTSVRPTGWLRDELRVQARGLTGHLDEFWPDVGPTSAWLGGGGEGWERGPYYLDGLVPLAYLLDDPRLIAKAKPWVEWTLTHQAADGAIGPAKNRDWWPIMIMLKVLTQYQEATGDPRVIPLMERYFAYQARSLAANPLKSWAIYRWQDELASILWLYNRNGDPRLLDFARQLKGEGFDWQALFADFPFPGKVARERSSLRSHGVNNAMGLKTAALWQLISHDSAGRDATARMFHVLDEYQGLPNGMFSADEHFGGRSPSQGTELCAVVETMFSLEIDAAVLGDAWLGDRLEKIAYNPLPGGQTADLWSHQYDQQPNQVLCSLGRRDWSTNGPEANLFGLEPNFGCCTANLHQGWPKFAASLWMASADDGLAAIAYAPSQVRSTVKGVEVTVDEATEYPFRGRIALTVSPASAIRFPLHLRVPGWAEGARILLNGQVTADAAARQLYADRSRMAERGHGGDHVPDESPDGPRIQRVGLGGARSAGILAAHRPKLEQTAPDGSRDRLGGLSSLALELRPPREFRGPSVVIRGGRSTDRRRAVRRRPSAGNPESDRPAPAAMGAGGRQRRASAAESCVDSAEGRHGAPSEGRGHHAGALCFDAFADHLIPGAAVATAVSIEREPCVCPALERAHPRDAVSFE